MVVPSNDFRGISTRLDDLWAHLKVWVRQRAELDEPPNEDECATEIKRIAQEVGCYSGLPPQALDFYASEATTMLWDQWSPKKPGQEVR